MSWTETSQGAFSAPIGELESFFVKTCAPNFETGRENWTIALDASLEVKSLPQGESLESRLRAAWLTLRFEHPALGVVLNEKCDGKLYHVLDKDAASQWATDTFQIHSEATTLDDVAVAFRPAKFPQLHYLPHTSEILFQSSHWRIDGKGALMLLRHYLELLSSPILMAQSLQWGTEGKNLTPSFEAALKVPVEDSVFAKGYAQSWLSEIQGAFPSTGLPYDGDEQTVPSESRRTSFVLDRDSTKKLVDACKRRNLSVTAACQAAAVLTTYERAPPNRKDLTHASMLSIDMRRACPPPFDGAAYAVNNYLAASFMYVTKKDATSFDAVARSLHFQMREKFVPTEYIESVRAICNTLMPLLTAPPPPGFPLASDIPISSLGILEEQVPNTYGDTAKGDVGVKVRNIRLGVETASRQVGLHLWTWDGCFHINASYNYAYHKPEWVKELLLDVKLCLEAGLEISLHERSPE